MSTLNHNPDQFMSDLRHVLAQGKKRIGFLLGAGVPASVSKQVGLKKPLIPLVDELTTEVLSKLAPDQQRLVSELKKDLGDTVNIEAILSRVRTLARVIGSTTIHGADAEALVAIGESICREIGNIVKVSLPAEAASLSTFAEWVGGAHREHPVEIFTTNYDLLLEQALERARVPYFDGFVGSREPFFEPLSVASQHLPARWTRLWKVHGSLGWGRNERGEFIRGKGEDATSLIYPTDAKYDETRKLPYLTYLDRLRRFVSEPDSMLITCGFSFRDVHLHDNLSEALSEAGGSVVALVYGPLAQAHKLHTLAAGHANLSVFGWDGAIVGCVHAGWKLGDLPYENWESIRATYWGARDGGAEEGFLLGEFAALSRYIALARPRIVQAETDARAEKQ